MDKNQPTDKQRNFLENRGITFPPTKAACRLLISYIVHGNGTKGKNESERIAITRTLHKQWVGQRVRRPGRFPGIYQTGTILYLLARGGQRVVEDRKFWREELESNYDPQPFRAFIRWEGGKSSTCPLSDLEITESD